MAVELGAQAGEFMFNKVTEKNEFLHNPTARTTMEEDLNKRFEVEQTIRDFIVINSTDPATTILNIACIQGRCELTLRGMDQSAASAISMGLANNALPGVRPLGTPVFFSNSDQPSKGYWLYMLLSY